MITLDMGRTIAGKYRLERPLAKGGMGAVWVARHAALDVVMALKFMAPDTASSREARIRFEREAKAAAQLSSPHIVQVHDYGIEEDTPYLVMELLDGEDLATTLRRRQRLSFAETQSILAQLSKGLRRAHEAGIVHRDLKPGNIFLQRNEDDVVVKILDFGIAKAASKDGSAGSEATTTSTVIGSPQYMSPEQLRSTKSVDHRTDLWAVGVILFRCVTGQLPFRGDDQMGLLCAICMDPIPLASQVAPDLSPRVDAFFIRALARDPTLRFQSIRELAEAFSALVADGATASPPSDSESSALDARRTMASDAGPSARVFPPQVLSISSPEQAVQGSPGRSQSGSPKSSGPARIVAAIIVSVALSAVVVVVVFVGANPSGGASGGSADSPRPGVVRLPEPPTIADRSASTPVLPPATSTVTASSPSPTPLSSTSARRPPQSGTAPPRGSSTKEPKNAVLGF